MDFVRGIMCLAKAGGNRKQAAELADDAFGRDSRVVAFLAEQQRAAVAGGVTGDSGWAGALSSAFGREFFGLVNEVSVYGGVNLRPAPLGCELIGVGTGASVYWPGEAKAVPLTALSLTGGTLPPFVLATIAVVSNKVFLVGDPNAELWVRSELVRQMAKGLDTAFLDPENEGVAGAKPASVTNGVTPVAATGDTEHDLKNLFKDFAGDFTTAYVVGKPETLMSLHSFERQHIGARGGSLYGIPAIASRNVPTTENGEILVLIDGQGIAAGDSGDVHVEISKNASLEMKNSALAGDGSTGTGAVMTSLFQCRLTGILVHRTLNWSAVQPSVSYLDGLQIEEVSA